MYYITTHKNPCVSSRLSLIIFLIFLRKRSTKTTIHFATLFTYACIKFLVSSNPRPKKKDLLP